MTLRSAHHGRARPWSRALALAPLLAAAAQPLHAQAGAEATIARVVQLEVRDGQRRAFEEGYGRHLDWHVRQRDPWRWYLWQVVTGPRAGLVVDATLDRRWAEFDHPVDPRGDAEDNAANVTPHVVPRGSDYWRRRPDLGGTLQPEAAPTLVHVELTVAAERAGAFERALREVGATADPRSALFESVTGQQRPRYILWLAAERLSGVAVAERPLETLLVHAPAHRRAALRDRLAGAITRMDVEVWRFRPDLSTCATPAASCRAVVP